MLLIARHNSSLTVGWRKACWQWRCRPRPCLLLALRAGSQSPPSRRSATPLIMMGSSSTQAHSKTVSGSSGRAPEPSSHVRGITRHNRGRSPRRRSLQNCTSIVSSGTTDIALRFSMSLRVRVARELPLVVIKCSLCSYKPIRPEAISHNDTPATASQRMKACSSGREPTFLSVYGDRLAPIRNNVIARPVFPR